MKCLRQRIEPGPIVQIQFAAVANRQFTEAGFDLAHRLDYRAARLDGLPGKALPAVTDTEFDPLRLFLQQVNWHGIQHFIGQHDTIKVLRQLAEPFNFVKQFRRKLRTQVALLALPQVGAQI